MLLPTYFVTDVESPYQIMTDELPFILYLADIVFDVGWCYVYLILDWCYVHWLMLMPTYITIGVIRLRADVIALVGYGRCYCHVADGIATGWTILFWLADVIAMWQMLSPLGGFILTLVLNCLTEPHPIYEAGGICLYFCLGMDCSP